MNKTKQAVNLFNDYANAYANRFMDVSLYHNVLNLFCQAVTKQHATVLELACGPGNMTKYILEQRPNFKVLATDLAPKMLDLAKANNPTAEVKSLDCKSIGRLSETYDAVLCGFGLPYLDKAGSHSDLFRMLHISILDQKAGIL